MSTYYGYSRVSTSAQEALSQTSFLQGQALKHGLIFVGVEESKSAKDYKRQILDIIELIKPGDILGVLMTSRIGRPNPGDEGLPYSWAQQVQSRGGLLEVSGKLIDTRNQGDAITYFIELMQAGRDWAQIRANTQRGLRQKRESGDFLGAGRYAPYGYKKVPGARELVHHPEHALIVKRLYQWVIKGGVISAFPRVLDSEGSLSSNGQPWQKNSLTAILHNPLNMGFTLREEGKKRDLLLRMPLWDMSSLIQTKNYPPIITPETYWEALAQYRNYKPRGRVHGTTKGGALFAGTFFCFHCEKRHRTSAMCFQTKPHKDAKYSSYALYNSLDSCSTNRSVREDPLTTMVEFSIDVLFSDLEETKTFVENEIKKLRSEDNTAEIRTLEGQINKNIELANVWNGNIINAVDPFLIAKWQGTVQTIKDANLAIRTKVNTLLSSNKEDEIKALIRDFSYRNFDRWVNGTIEEKREVLSKIKDGFYVNRNSIIMRFANGKTVCFDISRLKKEALIPFSVGFRGALQVYGTLYPDGRWGGLSHSRWKPSLEVREVALTRFIYQLTETQETRLAIEG